MSSEFSYRHHIIPRHEWKRRFGNLFGFNAPDNVVWLTLSQHIQVHQLLWELNGSEFDKIAVRFISGIIGKEEALREAIIAANKLRTGSTHTTKYKEHMSKVMMGNSNTLGAHWKFPVTICPHCSLSGGGGNMKRYHFENCSTMA